MLSAQILDEVIGNLADIFKSFTVSFWGIITFVLLSITYIIGLYLILGMVKYKNKEQQIKRTHFDIVEVAVTLVQYILSAILVILLIQMIFFSQYYTILLNIGLIISGGLGIILMSLFAYWLLSWVRRSKAFILLLFGLAMAVTAISIMSMVILFNIVWLQSVS